MAKRYGARKARFRQLDYEYEISIEERKLKILEAYNNVLQALATLKAKSDAGCPLQRPNENIGTRLHQR